MTTANAAMLDQIKSGQGFIAALDQSGGSTPKALKGYGIEADAFSNDEEMFGLIHDMRSRIVTAPCFNGEKVIGAILFERTMDGDAGGKPVPALLWERGVVPFLKVDKGLEDEADGVAADEGQPGPRCALRACGRQGRVRDQDAQRRQSRQPGRHQGDRRAAVRRSCADRGARPRPDHRARSEYQER